MRQDASAKWRGIVTVSGDGTVFEVLNGHFERPDWREALTSLPLGVVSGGTGNALARSLIHAQKELYNVDSQAVSCSVNAAKAGLKPLDLIYVETPYMSRVCAMGLTWGIIGKCPSKKETKTFICLPNRNQY